MTRHGFFRDVYFFFIIRLCDAGLSVFIFCLFLSYKNHQIKRAKIQLETAIKHLPVDLSSLEI